MNRAIVATLATFSLLLLAVACGGASPDIEDAALSSKDVPSDWQEADLDDDVKGAALWDVLPDLLIHDSDARLVLHAF